MTHSNHIDRKTLLNILLYVSLYIYCIGQGFPTASSSPAYDYFTAQSMPKMPLIRFGCKKEPSALENTHFLSDQLTAYRYAVNPPLIPLIGMEIGIIPTQILHAS